MPDVGKSNHFAAVFCLMKDWEQTPLRLPNIPRSKYLPNNTDVCSIFVLFFNACTFVSQEDTHMAWQSLWSSMLSVSTYVPDSNNAPCFISSSSFPPWQTRLVSAVINPAELKIHKWFSSSENWQTHIIYVSPFLASHGQHHSTKLHFNLSPDWKSAQLGEVNRTGNGCAGRITSVIYCVALYRFFLQSKGCETYPLSNHWVI